MTKATEATKQRIILAAESLFARQGIGGVSAREIATAANLRNNVSVQYHFGSMDGLILAILRFRMGQLDVVRGKMLEEAEQAGKLGDLGSLLKMICLPHLAITDGQGQHPYAAFMAQYLPRYQPDGFSWIMERRDPTLPSLVRLLDLFRARLDYLPKEVLYWRLTSAALHFINVLIRYEFIDGPPLQKSQTALRIQDCMAQISEAIAVPYESEIAPDIGSIVGKTEHEKSSCAVADR